MADNKPSFEEWYKTVPSDRNDTSNYNLRRAYELAPMESLERWRTATPEQLKDDSYHLMSVYFDPNTGVGEFMKSKNHPTLKGELDFYNGNSQESRDFRSRYSLDTSGDYYRYVPRPRQNIFSKQLSSPVPITMDENIPGRIQVNTSQNVQTPLVNNNQVNTTKSVNQTRSVNYNHYPGGTGANVGMDYLGGLYTSPEREEELRKSSVNKQRVLALADALRHIGNIYHTTKYSPAQIFNSPVMEERNRYLQEKAIRDANNYKFQSYQQARAAQEAKIRQAERDFEYKVNKDARDYELNKQKADAYLKNQEAQRGYTEARTKNEGLRGAGIEADNKLKAYKAEKAPEEFELKKRNTESQIAARRDASARGWANVGLARQRLALGWANHNLSRSRSSSGVLAADKNKDYVYAPSGATYSFPKGTFTGVKGKANINTIYNQMLKKGLVPDPSDSTKLDLEYGITKLSDDDKLAFIMQAASTSAGHDDFVYAANRLGYKYEGGMSDEYSREIFKEANRRKKRTPQKPAAQPKSNVNAGTKPSAPKAGASSNNNRQGAFSGFSIHNK